MSSIPIISNVLPASGMRRTDAGDQWMERRRINKNWNAVFCVMPMDAAEFYGFGISGGRVGKHTCDVGGLFFCAGEVFVSARGLVCLFS